MKKRSQKYKPAFDATKREHRITTLLSDAEQNIVDQYLNKYKIKNKSRWIRETILQAVYTKSMEDYPTLFGEHDMRR